MSNRKVKQKFRRLLVQGTPLVREIIERLELDALLQENLAGHGNEKISSSVVLLILVQNICVGRYPFYKLEKWSSCFDPRCFKIQPSQAKYLNDDRFGRALDQLFSADRASLMTELIVRVIKLFKVNTDQIHNDSTSVKAYGKMPGKTRSGFQLKKGHSKDHRPDLKQLIFNLTISRDGAVPIHFKAYPGNRTDDTIYVESWRSIRRLIGRSNFLFVADCKICSAMQLELIVGDGGRVVTIIPETWKLVQEFKEKLKTGKFVKKVIIWRRPLNPNRSKFERYAAYQGEYLTDAGYRVHWIYSTEKKKRDRQARGHKLQKTETRLTELMCRLNTGKLKNKERIELELSQVFEKYDTTEFYDVKIYEAAETERKQRGRGRPSSKTQYRQVKSTAFAIRWSRNRSAIKGQMRIDGIFPLLSTDKGLTSQEVLRAYKYQPKLEKRFHHFKSTHNAAPLLFKRIDRIESVLFVYFIALIVQSLIEREVRAEMEKRNVKSLDIYPEGRPSKYPTTEKIMEFFEGISTLERSGKSQKKEVYRDPLDSTHKKILKLLGMTEMKFWHGE